MIEPASARPSHNWHEGVQRGLERHDALARVTLATVRGSAPREAGVTMLVAARSIENTIGGGRLEWEAAAAARAMLSGAGPAAQCRKFVLGAELGQCCGGVVELWIERYTREDAVWLRSAGLAARQGPAVLVSTAHRSRVERRIVSLPGEDADADVLLGLPREQALPRLRRDARGGIALVERLDAEHAPVWLFGAGHVGRALAGILGDLPVSLTWIDSRPDQFPERIPSRVRILESDDPVRSVASAPADTRFFVMTHSHALDYAICRAILARADFASAGVIGSQSKAARFRARLVREGLAPESIARLTCPIGVPGIASKWPSAIAVAIAARMLQELSAASLARETVPAAPADERCAPPGECSGCMTSL